MPYVKTWMNDVCGEVLREETQEYLLQLFERTVENGLRFVRKKCVQAIAQVVSPVICTGVTGVSRVHKSLLTVCYLLGNLNMFVAFSLLLVTLYDLQSRCSVPVFIIFKL